MDLKKEFERAAEVCGVSVNDLTRNMWRSKSKPYPANAIIKAGGFTKAKLSILSGEYSQENKDHPFHTSKVSHLDTYQLSQYLGNLIAECAQHLKVPPHELEWYPFRRYIGFRYGDNSAGLDKDVITRVGGFRRVRDARFPPEPTKIVKEKQRLAEQANMNRRLGAHYTKQEYVIDRLIEDHAKKIFRGSITSIQSPPRINSQDTSLIVMISDTHIGNDLIKEETGAEDYGPVEESRRFASLIRQISQYKAKEIHVLLLGDLICGDCHGDGAILSEQIARAIHILNQFFAQLASLYPCVKVHVESGNHDRFKLIDPKRATKKKYNSYQTVIVTAVQYALSKTSHIEFFKYRTPYFISQVQDIKVLGTHGDTVIKPGMNFKQKEAAVKRMGKRFQEADVICMGHIHQAEAGYLNSGALMVVNPALTPVDDYAVSQGYGESHCGQYLLTVRKDRVSIELLKVSIKDDGDATLDEIIKPWDPDYA